MGLILDSLTPDQKDRLEELLKTMNSDCVDDPEEILTAISQIVYEVTSDKAPGSPPSGTPAIEDPRETTFPGANQIGKTDMASAEFRRELTIKQYSTFSDTDILAMLSSWCNWIRAVFENQDGSDDTGPDLHGSSHIVENAANELLRRSGKNDE